MRPLFPEAWRNETQIVAMVLSADSENDPDVIAVTGASAASFCSDLPFAQPIAAVRVGLLNGQLVANPTVAEQKTSLVHTVVVGSEEAIVMVEAGALEVSEDTVADALDFARTQIKRIITAIRELHAKINPRKVVVAPLPFDNALYAQIEKQYGGRLHDALATAKHPQKKNYHPVGSPTRGIPAASPQEAEAKREQSVRPVCRPRAKGYPGH